MKIVEFKRLPIIWLLEHNFGSSQYKHEKICKINAIFFILQVFESVLNHLNACYDDFTFKLLDKLLGCLNILYWQGDNIN